MAAKLEIMSRRDLVEQVFDVTPQQVLRRSAFDAQQMVVVPLTVYLNVQVLMR